jgi:hypothetical protein
LKSIEKDYNIFVVAHRYDELLDKSGLNYAVVKNIGVEFGAFSWFIENEWNKKSNVLFIQDDLIMKTESAIGDLFLKSRKTGLDFIKWGESKKKLPGGRCVYASRNILEVIMKEFGKLSFDKYNFGYLKGEKDMYDPLYKDTKVGSSFNHSSDVFVKNNIKTASFMKFDDIVFCRKGTHPRKKKRLLRGIPYGLSDNSVFNIKTENEMNKSAKKLCPSRSFDGYDGKGYTKWYDLCFQNIKKENLDILEFVVSGEKTLNFWKSYFVNSSVYGVTDKEEIDKIFNTPSCGMDMVVDNGCVSEDRISMFESMFPKLNPGGIYVFENLRRGYDGGKSPVVEYLKEKMDAVNLHGRDTYPNYEQFVYNENDALGFYEKRISAIHLYFDVGIVFKRYCR